MPHISPVSESPLLPIQRALFELLDAELSVPVMDFALEDEPYPYVMIGEATEVPDNAHDRYGSDTTHTLHIWTEFEGWSQGLEIEAEIRRLLDHRKEALAVDGFWVVTIRREMIRTLRDPNPRLRHVPVTYRVITEQLPAA